ncbi:hypothetical protein GCM10029992_30500 [Glycomyces albus]
MQNEERPTAESPSTGELDLEARQALRRVSGIASTELADVTDAEYRRLRLERVVLVGVWTEGSAEDAENSLAELAALAETAGSEVADGLLQRRSSPTRAPTSGPARFARSRTPSRRSAPTPSSATANSPRGSSSPSRRPSTSRSSTAPP